MEYTVSTTPPPGCKRQLPSSGKYIYHLYEMGKILAIDEETGNSIRVDLTEEQEARVNNVVEKLHEVKIVCDTIESQKKKKLSKTARKREGGKGEEHFYAKKKKRRPVVGQTHLKPLSFEEIITQQSLDEWIINRYDYDSGEEEYGTEEGEWFVIGEGKKGGGDEVD